MPEDLLTPLAAGTCESNYGGDDGDIPTLHVLTVLALVGTGTSIWAIAVGREETVYHLSIIPVAFLVYCLA
jgi:hypothetical protein